MRRASLLGNTNLATDLCLSVWPFVKVKVYLCWINHHILWTDYNTNTQITKELKITAILDKLLEYKRNWIKHVNRMPLNGLPRVMKHYFPTGRRNYGRPLKRLLDT